MPARLGVRALVPAHGRQELRLKLVAVSGLASVAKIKVSRTGKVLMVSLRKVLGLLEWALCRV